MAFYLNDGLITWVSQKQRCVALSRCEAEFMAATAAACKGIWLQKILSLISNVEAGPVTLYIDNRFAIDLSKNPVFHGRSKHIDIPYHLFVIVLSNETYRAAILQHQDNYIKDRIRRLYCFRF